MSVSRAESEILGQNCCVLWWISQGRCAAAVWCADFSLTFRLPDHSSFLTAELFAIFSAITFIRQTSKNYIIYSDSLSSISSLSKLNSKSHYLTYKIADIINSSPSNEVIIEWVTSHMGIHGNEEADQLAARALNITAITKIKSPIDDLNKKLKQHYRREWQESWAQSKSHLHQFKPKIRAEFYLQLPRKQQIAISRLRLYTTRFTHQHLFTKSPRPQC